MAEKKQFISPGVPGNDVPVSLFDLSHSNSLTARIGRAYPCMCLDAPAHSTIRINPSFGFDFMPMQNTIQSNVRAHLKFYKIPKRILWKDFKAWKSNYGNYVKPYLKRSNVFHTTGSLADYMGIPSVKLESATQSKVTLRSQFGWVSPNALAGSPVQDSNIFDAQFDNNDHAGCFVRLTNPIPEDITIPFSFELLKESAFNFVSSSKFYLRFFICNQPTDVIDNRWWMSPARLEAINHAIDLHEILYYPFFDALTPISTISRQDDLGAESFIIPESSLNRNVTVSGQSFYSALIQFYPAISHVAAVNQALKEGKKVGMLIFWTKSNISSYGSPDNQMISSVDSGDSVGKTYSLSSTSSGEKTVYTMPVVPYLNSPGMRPSVTIPFVATLGGLDSSPFVSVDGNDPALPICALPFRAYEFIHNFFYRNEYIDPFMIDGNQPFDEYITTNESGADTDTPLELFKVPYEYDLFTTCVKTPTFGRSPLVRLQSYDEGNVASILMHPEDGDPYVIKLELEDDGTIKGVEDSTEDASHTPVHLLKDALNYGISIEDFRNVSALQRFQDRMQKVVQGHGSKYYNFVKEFYGTSPNIGEEYPEYLGGHTENISISKIVNTAKSADANLGEFAGMGSIRSGKGNEVSCFCSEDCYIMGILYFTVTPCYQQMLARHFTKTHPFEDLNPQFNNITPQPVYTHQLAPLQLDDEHLFDVFGFNRPFAEYVSMQDEVHGHFRTDMQSYLIQRLYGNQPRLGADFIYIDSDELTDVFMDREDNDKIFGMIYFDMRNCKLPLPKVSVPRII